jgi:hypothetical protein
MKSYPYVSQLLYCENLIICAFTMAYFNIGHHDVYFSLE